MTKTVFLLLVLCYVSKAEYSAKCGDNTQSSVTLKASNDGVEGRYRFEWCTSADRNVTNWELVMRYNERRAPERCQKYSISHPLGAVHSRFNENVSINLNCTLVCFSTNLDLIFNGTCYHIKTMLQRNTTSSSPHDSLHYIVNPYPKEHFTKSEARVLTQSNGEELVVLWYLGYIPAADYSVKLCTTDFKWCVDISSNCSTTDARQTTVRCALRAPFGCYSVHLAQHAPWANALSLFEPQISTNYEVCHNATVVAEVDGGRGALWWVCGACAGAVLAGALALRAGRRRLADNLRLRVLRDWLDRPETEPVMKPINNNETEEKQRIVLLYARDCPQFTRVAELLRDLLALASGCQVVDLYSAATVREAARAPAEWLQRALAGERARVVLLQSPAAARLHAPPAAPAAPLQAPQHGRRVLNREPHSSDWLFTLALRRLAETGHIGLPYRKYFVAEIAGLEAEVLPHLTRLRRYSLPAAAELLLRDVSFAPPAPAPLHALRQAAAELVDYVREHPDYVHDQFYVC